MNRNEIVQEVTLLVEQHVNASEITPMDVIVHEVMANHQRITGPDRDFFVYCGFAHVRDVTRDVLRGMRAGIGGEVQAELFPGAKRVQRAYTIERDEEQKLVPLEKMTPGDMRAKARELRGMAHGLLEHAQELDDLADKMDHAPEARA